MYTESIEDYLKAIYEIQKENGKVSTNSLSEKTQCCTCFSYKHDKKAF